jgi:hypothetical protein
MLLNNPAQGRSLSQLLSSLPESARAEAAMKVVRLNRALASRHKHDAELADSLLRVLKLPLGKELRQTIREICAV